MTITCGWSVSSLGTPVSSTNKTDRQDITERFLKLVLSITTPSNSESDQLMKIRCALHWCSTNNIWIPTVFFYYFELYSNISPDHRWMILNIPSSYLKSKDLMTKTIRVWSLTSNYFRFEFSYFLYFWYWSFVSIWYYILYLCIYLHHPSSLRCTYNLTWMNCILFKISF